MVMVWLRKGERPNDTTYHPRSGKDGSWLCRHNFNLTIFFFFWHRPFFWSRHSCCVLNISVWPHFHLISYTHIPAKHTERNALHVFCLHYSNWSSGYSDIAKNPFSLCLCLYQSPSLFPCQSHISVSLSFCLHLSVFNRLEICLMCSIFLVMG